MLMKSGIMYWKCINKDVQQLNQTTTKNESKKICIFYKYFVCYDLKF